MHDRFVVVVRSVLLISRPQSTYGTGSPSGLIVCNQSAGDLHPALVRTIKEASSSIGLAPKVSTEHVDLAAVTPNCSWHFGIIARRQDAARL